MLDIFICLSCKYESSNGPENIILNVRYNFIVKNHDPTDKKLK